MDLVINKLIVAGLYALGISILILNIPKPKSCRHIVKTNLIIHLLHILNGCCENRIHAV